MRGRSRAGQVVNLVDFYIQRVHDVVHDQLEVLVTDPMLNVLPAPRVRVVDDYDLVPVEHEPVDEVAADEPRPAGDEYPPAVRVRAVLDLGKGLHGGRHADRVLQLDHALAEDVDDLEGRRQIRWKFDGTLLVARR